MEAPIKLKRNKIHSVPYSWLFKNLGHRLYMWNQRRYWRKALKEVESKMAEKAWYLGVEKIEDKKMEIEYKWLQGHRKFLRTMLKN